MKNIALTLAVMVGLAMPAYAQDCTPVGINNGTGEYLFWGTTNQQTVWGATVPAGKIQLIDNIGIATTDNRSLAYAIQKLHPNGHYVPVTGMSAGSHGTPVVAWTGKLILTAGSTVGGRVNSDANFATMGVLYTGWEFPESCLGRLLGTDPVAIGIIGPIAPVDYTAFTTALEQAAKALQGVVEAVP